MSKSTYSSLYELVVKEIKNRSSYDSKSSYKGQLSRDSIAPLSGTATTDASISAITTAIETKLGDIIPSHIISGLTVSATSPASNSVIVSAGKGVSQGEIYEVDETTIPIPFDTTNDCFFLTLYKNRIQVEVAPDDRKLKIAKIIITKPGFTNTIYDTLKEVQEDINKTHAAYIVNFTEYRLYGDAAGKFEEDTIELLRDNISPILADNLIGNLNLSEHLTITNIAGTLEANSTTLLIKDTQDNILAKFNKDGTYFYDSNGKERAKFTADSAHIGNILVNTHSIQSGDFASGAKGFRIQDTGRAEFEDVIVRGQLQSSVFTYDKVSAVGGKLVVAPASTLDTDMTALDSSTLTSVDSVFSDGDILFITNGTQSEYLEITDITNAPTYVVLRDKTNLYSSNNNPIWLKGQSITSVGNGSNQTGYISLDTVSDNSPFIDIVQRNSNLITDITVKSRLGNLEGITDTDFGGTLSGYGLYATNVYLKGSLFAPTIKTALTGARIELDQFAFQGYSSDGTLTLSHFLSGDLAGDFIVGNLISSNYLQWDSSEDTLIIRGSLNASDITTGALNADLITTGSLLTNKIDIKSNDSSDARTVFNGLGIQSYNADGEKTLDIVDGEIIAKNITLIDPDDEQNYSYLDGGALKFHDKLGDVPYVKRIANGIVNTGEYVYLQGWTTKPNVIVSSNEITSYDKTYSSQSQKWRMYVDEPVTYYNSSTDYGYKFMAHGLLQLASTQGSEQIKDVNLGSTITTESNTTSTILRMKFQLWRADAAPSLYQYGTMSFTVSYRLAGSTGAWTDSSQSFEQPHGSIDELKRNTDKFINVIFPSAAQWELKVTQVSLTYTNSSLQYNGDKEYHTLDRTVTPTTVSCSSEAFASINGHPSYEEDSDSNSSSLSISGSIPSNVTNTSFTWNVTYTIATYLKEAGYGNCYGTVRMDNGLSTQYSSGTSTGTLSSLPSSFVPSLFVTSFASCSERPASPIPVYNHATASASIALNSGTITHTYYTITGASQSYTYTSVYSLQNTFASAQILDPYGVLNWLAIAYS